MATNDKAVSVEYDNTTSGLTAEDVQAAIDENAAAIAGAGPGDMFGANNLSDVANAAAAFGNIKQAATTEATGVVEIATQAEVNAGTAGKVVTADTLIASTAVLPATTANVLTALVGMTAGAVGSVALLNIAGSTSNGQVFNPGDTRAGSELVYANTESSYDGTTGTHTGSAPAGTWRLLGYIPDTDSSTPRIHKASLWVRIA